ncbi:MAG: nickel pincer cofactor biosynthesis protein LarC [Eubacteriales bacterium]|nr:nickel pincer cofactor biosynthesis protein LarC [Eubacteriales bacterium]
MKKALYLECKSGISGDMSVAALLDLGADRQVLKNVLNSLPLEGYQTKISRVKKSALDCCDFDVILDKEHENRDHDMEYLFGHLEGHEHSHEGYSHEGHTHGEHSHVHRGMKEIREIIYAGDMTDKARTLAIRIFEILAEAEAKAHGVPVEEVHFHEVGAVDSIVDIVSAAVCFDNLGVEEVIVPPMTEGQGTVRCQHGILPIPVPAVANIAAKNQLELRICNIQGELITPTGAAFAAAVKTTDQIPDQMKVLGIGLGAGKREYKCPGFLRAMLVEIPEEKEKDVICKLETNIDDCSGEVLGYTMEKLLKAGARDVFYQPIFMKKNRPAWLLSVICTEDTREVMETIIFRETTTIGIRRTTMERTVLSREFGKVRTPYGDVNVKVCRRDAETFAYPEYESVKKAAENAGVPFQSIYNAAMKEFEEKGIIHDEGTGEM